MTGDDARPLIVRVEVKRTISASRGQVPAYIDALPKDGRPHTVILLGPRDSLTAEDEREVPASVPRRSWQATARTIAAHPADDPVQRWLLRELLTFLHKEQLMDVEALGPEHFTALAYHREAITGLTAVCDIASAQLSALFGEVDSDDRRPGSPDKFTQSWEAPPGLEDDAWGNTWFDWGVYRSNRAINLPTLHFFAGLSTESRTFGPPEWIERLQQRADENHHFKFESWSGDAERLRRIGLPQEVLRGRTLEDQGASVARWVKETHTVLKEHGPPPGPRSQVPRM